jgi:hypothetical protein
VDTLLSTSGCDSIEVTTLSVITATNQSINLSGCGSVLYKGVSHTTNTTVQDTLRGTLGCDSIYLTVNITVKQNSTFSQIVSICQGQSISVGTHSHSTPGTYTDTINNAIGCDSIVTTTLSYAGTPISAGNNISICLGSSTQLRPPVAAPIHGRLHWAERLIYSQSNSEPVCHDHLYFKCSCSGRKSNHQWRLQLW